MKWGEKCCVGEGREKGEGLDGKNLPISNLKFLTKNDIPFIEIIQIYNAKNNKFT